LGRTSWPSRAWMARSHAEAPEKITNPAPRPSWVSAGGPLRPLCVGGTLETGLPEVTLLNIGGEGPEAAGGKARWTVPQAAHRSPETGPAGDNGEGPGPVPEDDGLLHGPVGSHEVPEVLLPVVPRELTHKQLPPAAGPRPTQPDGRDPRPPSSHQPRHTECRGLGPRPSRTGDEESHDPPLWFRTPPLGVPLTPVGGH